MDEAIPKTRRDLNGVPDPSQPEDAAQEPAPRSFLREVEVIAEQALQRHVPRRDND